MKDMQRRIFGTVLFVILQWITVSTAAAPSYILAFNEYIDDTTPQTGNYTLSYYIQDSVIHFEVKLIGMVAWVGCGFHSVGDENMFMKGADVYFFEFKPNGTVIGTDGFSAFPGKPAPDTSKGCVDNIVPGSVSGVQGKNTTTLYWARPLVTTDSATCDAQFTAGLMKVMYATGKRSNTFNFHGNNAGQVEFSFISAPPPPPTHALPGPHTETGLSSGEIGVIVIGVLVFLIAGANVAGGFFLHHKRKTRSSYSPILDGTAQQL